MPPARRGARGAPPPRFPDAATLAVIERFSLHLRRTGALAVRGRPTRRAAAAGLDFVGYADYGPGEDLRHVDWAIWGRTRELVVRRFADEAAGLLVVLLDASGSMGVCGGRKWALGRGLAAAMIHAALSELHQVLLGIVTPDGLHTLPIGGGPAAAVEAFDRLASATPRGVVQWAAALAELPIDGGRGDVVLISDFLDAAGPEGVLDGLTAQGLRVDLVRVIDPHEFALPDGPQRLADPEGTAGQPAPTGAARAQFAERLAAYQARLPDAARRSGASLVEVQADWPLATALTAVFERRRAAWGRG